MDVQFFSGGCGGGVRDGCYLRFGGTIGRGNVNGRGFEFANALGASLVEEAWNIGRHGEGHEAVGSVIIYGVP